MNHFFKAGYLPGSMGGRLQHGSCTAGCGENERAAVGEPDAEHFNGAGDSFQIQSGRDCVLRTKQDAAGCPAYIFRSIPVHFPAAY